MTCQVLESAEDRKGVWRVNEEDEKVTWGKLAGGEGRQAAVHFNIWGKASQARDWQMSQLRGGNCPEGVCPGMTRRPAGKGSEPG